MDKISPILNMVSYFKHQVVAILNYFRHKKSFAQDGEDVVLLAFFENRKRYHGFFVDVGAHHPVRFSNTWIFYRRGWRGINIDPTPGSMQRFRMCRRRDINLEIGVGGTTSSLTFFCFNEPALNTFDPDLAKIRNVGHPYRIISEVCVPVKPLAKLLDENLPKGQKIDFLTIDVEGLDFEVLRSNDWIKYPAEFVLVEDPGFQADVPDASEIYRFLKGHHYQIVATLKRTIIYRKEPNISNCLH